MILLEKVGERKLKGVLFIEHINPLWKTVFCTGSFERTVWFVRTNCRSN